jgi:hypothetical protein
VQKEMLDSLNENISFLNEQIIIKKMQLDAKNEIIEGYKSILKSNRGRIQYLESKFNE